MNNISQPPAIPCTVRLFTMELAACYLRNQEFHCEWSPIPPAGFFTLEFQRRRLGATLELTRQEGEYRFGIFPPQEGGELPKRPLRLQHRWHRSGEGNHEPLSPGGDGGR